jgi:hypothetical protein
MSTESTNAESRWTDHFVRACEAFAAEMRGAVPEPFSSHARGSLKEALLAMRSLLDAGIERLEEKPATPARKVEVE